MKDIAQAVARKIEENPSQMPGQIAAELQVSEFEVVAALPVPMSTQLPVERLATLMDSLPSWGPMTTIVSVAGSIFEFKGAFPKGKPGHGYYNLITKGEGLHGHLKLDAVQHIALVSKPFMGSESHSIQFFDARGAIIFKIYLGRDSKRVLLADQVERFNELKRTLAN
ncbi:heme utilization cystosolic carrier protein HutX [Ferrimonas sp. YFM]|uniref:heme utilization cystosolic carrier protein HutX n=1 Tax=Ferrimonas sp. YFM TaxID=3028878 RepID=UPI002572CD4F|nr:heme utilization cystosolic carrier protein HutX [Ferrimonas sp. YFM]BDY04269.1 heme iron utilization protein HmuX [Ferrimonas sp. YFM]